jgi:hypothetical protein
MGSLVIEGVWTRISRGVDSMAMVREQAIRRVSEGENARDRAVSARLRSVDNLPDSLELSSSFIHSIHDGLCSARTASATRQCRLVSARQGASDKERRRLVASPPNPLLATLLPLRASRLSRRAKLVVDSVSSSLSAPTALSRCIHISSPGRCGLACSQPQQPSQDSGLGWIYATATASAATPICLLPTPTKSSLTPAPERRTWQKWRSRTWTSSPLKRETTCMTMLSVSRMPPKRAHGCYARST